MVLIFVMLVDIVSGVHYDSQYMLVMFGNMVLMFVMPPFLLCAGPTVWCFL